jgi:hypothetical protein
MSAKAVTSPSGMDRTRRSADCTAEANAKGGTDNERKSIRLACLANAAPPASTGTPTRTPAPTPSHDQLGALPH